MPVQDSSQSLPRSLRFELETVVQFEMSPESEPGIELEPILKM